MVASWDGRVSCTSFGVTVTLTTFLEQLCREHNNDIVEDINCSIRLFADDTSWSIIVDDPIQAADQLNLDLAKIHRWADKWLVTFNP